MRHTLSDHALFTLLLLIPLIEWKWSWPRHLARIAADPAHARIAFYRKIILGEWIPTIALLVFWAALGRPWRALQLAGDTPLRLGLGFGYVLVLIGLLLFQRRALLSRPDRRARARRALNYVEPLLPYTPNERKYFWAVSATAGICEELFFRAFLPWYLTAWMSLVWAVVMASILFGIGHVYLGLVQVPKTAIVGFLFAVVVGLTGSIWPAMLLHAAVDWNSGELAFRLLRSAEPQASS